MQPGILCCVTRYMAHIFSRCARRWRLPGLRTRAHAQLTTLGYLLVRYTGGTTGMTQGRLIWKWRREAAIRYACRKPARCGGGGRCRCNGISVSLYFFASFFPICALEFSLAHDILTIRARMFFIYVRNDCYDELMSNDLPQKKSISLSEGLQLQVMKSYTRL